MTTSAIYRGSVEHLRHAPIVRRFRYRLYMLHVDLEELDGLFAGRWLWSRERWNVASWHRADYLGDPRQPLREAVLDQVQAATGTRPDGAVRVLTQPRCLGFAFNPVTFYYCHAVDGRVAAVVAEITNTPWRERHRYVIASGDDGALERRFTKEFHVSPFMPMQQEYRWSFSPPGERITVRMQNLEEGSAVFDATLRLERRPWSAFELARTLSAHPFMTAKVVFAIYYQALRLRLAGAPFHSHPGRVVAEAPR